MLNALAVDKRAYHVTSRTPLALCKFLQRTRKPCNIGQTLPRVLVMQYIQRCGGRGLVYETMVKQCSSCQLTRPSPPVAQLHPWEWPNEPWSRLHIDFAGPFMGHMYLVLVDSHSKWLDVQVMQSISSAKTIEKLRAIFATHGLPKTIVSDNGPSATNSDHSCVLSDFKHTKTDSRTYNGPRKRI